MDICLAAWVRCLFRRFCGDLCQFPAGIAGSGSNDLRRRHVLAEKRSVRREYTLSNRSSMAIARCLLDRPASEQVHKREIGRQVREAIATMNAIDREVLLLRHVEELTNAEAAEVMQVDPATASQRYGRALRRLRDALLKQGFYDDQ